MSAHLDSIKGYAQRMIARWPDTQPGLALIVSEAAAIARELGAAKVRIEELESGGGELDPVVVSFGQGTVLVDEPQGEPT